MKNKFTVKLPKAFFWFMLCGVALPVFLPVPFTVFQGPQHLALYISCGIIALPFVFLMLRSKLFRVTVNGQKITVRKGTGRQYSFDVSEIVRVNWRINRTRMGQLEKITVRTVSKHFGVETSMAGFERMAAYLSANVDSGKINTVTNNMI